MDSQDKYFAIIIAIGGIFSLIRFFWILYFYKSIIKRWNIVQGVVTNNEVKYKDADGDGGWQNSIEYTFNVGASIFVSGNFSKNIGLLHFSKDAVHINENYPVGKSITVYYNPKNPQDSVIDNKFSLYNFGIVLFGIVCFLIAYYTYN